MSAVTLLEIKGSQFTAAAHVEGDRISMRVTGSADGASKPDFDRVIDVIEHEASRRNVREVSVDVQALEFMDSSCIKSFVSWISALQDLPVAERYTIHFLCNPEAHWQRRSMNALSLFGEDLVQVDF